MNQNIISVFFEWPTDGTVDSQKKKKTKRKYIQLPFFLAPFLLDLLFWLGESPCGPLPASGALNTT